MKFQLVVKLGASVVPVRVEIIIGEAIRQRLDVKHNCIVEHSCEEPRQFESRKLIKLGSDFEPALVYASVLQNVGDTHIICRHS